MSKNALLMSIRPCYADKIFNGTKTVELRRIQPKYLADGDLVFVYVSSPVKSLIGAFSVASVVKQDLSSLWNLVKNHAGVTHDEFLQYYSGVSVGVGIFISNIWLLPIPIKLAELKKEIKDFHPPQSFRYTSIEQITNFH